LGAVTAGAGWKEKPAPDVSHDVGFILLSTRFKPGELIPLKYTCDGKDVSPELLWGDPPKGTKSFVLIMEDTDASKGSWVHWLVYDLPARLRRLPENFTRKEVLPTGAQQGQCWGYDKGERIGYAGPCPPPGLPHHYVFSLYALSKKTGLPPKATKSQVVEAMKGNILGSAELMVRYGR
jgi:Raf kinase inhibitor-like YbhB/YbcL family protein